MSEPTPPKPRGRPKGSQDSYPRSRICKKLPPKTTIEVLMPAIQELVESAELNGYHKGKGRPSNRTQEAVDRATTGLLAALRKVMDNKHE